MRWIKRLVLMIQFLTHIPIPVNLEAGNEDFGKGLVLAPLVGIMIGGILALAFWLLQGLLSPFVLAVLLMVLYIILTGGLHLDGLGDTFDGLFSNRSRERILEIMRDSRVGTNAVLALVSVLLLNIGLLASADSLQGLSPWQLILLFPVAGRMGSVTGAGISRYARSGEGLGKTFIDYCGAREVVEGLLLGALLSFCVGGLTGLLLAIFPAITAVLLTMAFSRKIGGATGDILGAVCELNQTLFLLFALLVLR